VVFDEVLAASGAIERVFKEITHMGTRRTSDRPFARDKTSNGVDQARIRARPPVAATKK
jgi:hypothetical protein